ncbi:5846_t:CDS:2 [Scutellospora calospora]|uniref:5846_t:CDS:1 n=1 Tax=Scutellospora calospora TaxID=85575 RepID=A0ACA9KJS2_9GLOM|nr:5846_t:CDS:2 [Scutellospora calospora]
MEEKHTIQGSNTSKSIIQNNTDGILYNSDAERHQDSRAAINLAQDFMKDFSEPSNLFGFKILVEDLRLKFSAKLLINALKLLSDVSLFDYYTEDIISHFELHLRTWVATLEKVVCSSIILNQEFYDKLYSSLVSFIDIHYHITLFFKQEVNLDNLDNAGDNYLNFQNFNINFLLIHLRDSLHCIRNNEARSEEFLRHGKDFILKLIRITPKGDKSQDILEIFEGPTLPKLDNFFNFKNSIPNWYQKWREFLFLYYSLQDLIRDSNHYILQHRNEAYILEFLCQYIFDQNLNQSELEKLDFSEILNNQEDFSSLFIEYRFTDLPYFLWFGLLDFAQNLCRKITQQTTLTFFYYLGLEILKKTKYDYVQFKSLELLLSLSNKDPEWFENLVQTEINKHCASLSIDSQQKFKNLLDNVNLKLQLDDKFIKNLISTQYKESWFFKEKFSASKSDTLFKEIIMEQLTCPITGEITGDFLILRCNHSISYDAIRKGEIILSIENKSIECPFCKTIFKLESIYKFSRNSIIKVKLPTFNRAIKALRRHEYSTAVIWLTRILHFYPKSYSVRCRRALASWKIEMYSQALNDLTIAIQLNPKKSLAYIYRCHIYLFFEKVIDASNDIEVALKIDPNNIDALLYKTKIYSDQKKFNEAKLEIRKILNIGKINFVHPILSILFERFDKPNKMIFGLGNSLPIQLYDMEHTTISGYVLLRSYNKKLAKLCVKAINDENNNIISIGIRGILYYRLGSFGKALINFQEILEIFPSTIALDWYEKTYQMLENYNNKKLLRLNKIIRFSLNQTNTFNSNQNNFNILKDQDEHF